MLLVDLVSPRNAGQYICDGWRLDAAKREGLGILVASWLPEVEGETLANGVSNRVLGVMDGSSMVSGKKELVSTGTSECPDWAAGVSAQVSV